MGAIGRSWAFLRSRSGQGYLLFLGFSTLLTLFTAYTLYYTNLRWFEEHKSEEKVTALHLVDAFVGSYANLRADLSANAPAPATFRTRAIALFDKAHGSTRDTDFFRMRWIGLTGAAAAPADQATARIIQSFAHAPQPQPVSQFRLIDGRLVFRTIYPAIPGQGCADCATGLQPTKPPQAGTVPGAFVIDVPVGPFLHTSMLECIGLGLVLFIALGAAGLVVSIRNFRHARDREVVQASIAKSEARFRDFAQSSSDWFWEEDENYRLNYVSQNAQSASARSSTQSGLIGKTLRENFPSGSSAAQWDMLDEDRKARRPFQNFRLQTMNRKGEVRHFSISGKPIFDEEKRFLGYRGTGRDITGEIAVELELARRVEERTAELRTAQGELVRKERLSALGQVTATVAHELRNPLSAIRNTVFVIKESVVKSGLNLDRPITRVERNIGRCDRIISDLLDYTRVRDLHHTLIEADPWLREVLSEQHLPDGIELSVRLDAPGSWLDCDVERMRRVVINILENAAQAMRDGEVGAGERRITVSSRPVDTRFELTVDDTGPGIPSDVLPKVFEPLFSTKSFGTGLGLPTVKQIVEQHGGQIEIFSETGKGTRVVIRLPAHAAEEIAA